MALQGRVLGSFERQVRVCRDLGSPFTARLCGLLAARLDGTCRFGARIADWPSDPGPDALPLRAAGALHALKRSGHAPDLAAAYPPHDAGDDALWEAVAGAIAAEDGFLHDWLDSPPQTNEVARSAVILGGALALAAETGLPLALLEIGSSAGLNLGFDAYAYELGEGRTWGDTTAPVLVRCDWQGAPAPLDAALAVASRAGCDRNPLDPSRPEDRERLLAYVWADQEARLARTGAAIAAAADAPWRVERADAGAWLAAVLDGPGEPGQVRTVLHTIVWQYLPEASKAAAEAAIRTAGAQATAEAPFAWFRMEAESREGAGVWLTLWPGGRERRLGLADYHGRWVRWSSPAGEGAP